MRETITIITTTINKKRWVHFTEALAWSTGAAPGPDYSVVAEGPLYSLWFPVVGDSLFNMVESILSIHRIAHNVVSIEAKAQPGDYLVTYNPTAPKGTRS